MKLVWTILYLAAVSATMFLANKVVGSSMKRIRAGRQRTWLGLAAWVISLLSSAIPLLGEEIRNRDPETDRPPGVTTVSNR